jgi:carbonic anhydrase
MSMKFRTMAWATLVLLVSVAPAPASPNDHAGDADHATAAGHSDGLGADGTLDADAALARLLEGNQRFVDATLTHPNQDAARRGVLVGGQTPFAIVLSCSDSRVPPELLFDQGLGDLFVVRVAGNVADEIGLASIEYAAEHLGVRLVMVLGHERCGAVTAAVKGGEVPGHLPALMAALQPAVAGNKDPHGDPVEGAMRANIELTAAQLRESGPVLAKLVEEGALKVVGARYDLDTGVVEMVDPPAHHAGVGAAQAMGLLVVGNRRFVNDRPLHAGQDAGRRVELATSQAPSAVVLCCSDSRVAPEVIFDRGLGDLFVVRVAGNVANDVGIASIEYAVEHLGVRLVVVLGHESCGAVTAAVKGGELPGHLPALMAALQPAVDVVQDPHVDPVDGAVRANVDLTVAQLRASGPILSEFVHKGELKIVGARYDLDTGVVAWPEEAGGHLDVQAAAEAAGDAVEHMDVQAAGHTATGTGSSKRSVSSRAQGHGD